MNAIEFLTAMTKTGASDLFIIAGRPLSYKKGDTIHVFNDQPLMPPETEDLIKEIYHLAKERDFEKLVTVGDDDFSFAIKGLSRFRVSAYLQRGSFAAVIRIITFNLPDPECLGIPDQIMQLSRLKKGLVLVTGPAGSGKSTTLACMIDEMNKNYEKHIITLEDPLEFLHRHKKSIVSQREINSDTESYITALRASLRQSPDVILLGEMRDFETMSIAMTAAETGHLVLSTLHTSGAANTIDRIIDVFPPNQQHQIAVQLSSVLQAVVSQQLIPATDNSSVVPAFELMTVTPAIKNMIRENKIHQIDALIYSSSNDTLFSMDAYLQRLFQSGKISKEEALSYASNPEMLKRKLL